MRRKVEPVVERPSWDDYFLTIAHAVSTRASCSRRQVGAVIVDDEHRIVSTGYNGAAPGLDDCLAGACPRGRLDAVAPDSDYDHPGTPGYCIAAHAEANALLFARRDLRACRIYITHAPCPGCTKLLAAAGIARAYWPGGSCEPRAEITSRRDE